MSAAAGDTSYVNKIDCEVVDYQLVNSDPSYYNNHIFMIKVWIQKHMYAIDRSYAAFCDLDARLRKQYARSNIPPLKLAGASMTTKLINSTNNLKESKKNLTFPPESDSDRAELKPLRRVESSEIIAQKKKYLTSYLQGLLKIPEIVLSDILLFFLDEESTHGEPVTEAIDEQSDSKEIHIVLKGLEMTTRMVRADRQQEISVPPNHFVVWSFNTLNHDVGFSIAYKEKEILKYQRYDSHQKLIMGHFEMPEAGTVRFVWDNSYSRWRSKTVNYVIKVVCPEEYMAAQATAAQMKKDRLLFLKQRGMVKTALVALSTNILSSRGNSIAAMAIPAASTTLLSTSTSSPSLAGSGRAAEEKLKRTSSTKEVHSANSNDTSKTSPTSTPNTSTTPASSPAQTNRTATSTSNNNTIANTNTTNATSTASSYWEFADMSEAVREINRLRNEKKTLQQALSESETALVTERSIAAQVLSQFDAAARKKQALEEELGELKGEFDVFRENYFNEMESRLAETLATFEVYNSSNTNNHNGSVGANASPGRATKTTDESENRARQKSAGTASDALTAAPTAQSLFGAHDTTESDESDTLAEASPTIIPGTADDADTADVSLNQLINLTSTELSRLGSAALVSYFAQLSAYTQTMLRRGYLTRDMEAMVARLKNEKKQLKAYAIQMKTSLDGLTLRYIHLDQDRAVLLAQVKELKDLVVLLETDRRGLREHIAALSGADSDKSDNAINSSGEGAGSGIGVGGITQSCTALRTADSSGNSGSNSGSGSRECADSEHVADLTRTGSNTSAESTNSTSNSSTHDQHATVPSFHSWVKSTSSTTNTNTNTNTCTGNTATTSAKSSEEESFSLGVWLNSGLASASAAMSFEGFDFGESHYYHGASSSGNGGGGASGGRGGTESGGGGGDRSSATTGAATGRSVRSSSGVLSRLSRAEDAEPMDAPTSTIIISMEDLQQASLQSTSSSNSSGAGGTMHPLQALRSLRAPYEYKPDADTGSDCGYSVCDEDHAHASLDPLDQALHRANSNTSTTSNTSNISSNSNDKPPLATTSGDSGGFTKVTEQLYGILPSWGQIQKLRSSSLI